MPKEKKPGWLYYKSNFFNEEFAIHKDSGWVYFEKGAKYSPEEIKLLSDNNLQMDLATHNVKTVIPCEIVEIVLNKPVTSNEKKAIEPVEGELDIF